MRNYLGKIKTPYNKQSLLNSLVIFLNKPESREKILNLIDPEEAAVISYIYYREGSGFSELSGAFRENYREREFGYFLGNLEERFLIYSLEDENGPRYFINPIFSTSIGERIATPLALVSSRPAGERLPGRHWFTDAFLTAFLAFIVHENVAVSSGNGLRSRIISTACSYWPFLKWA